MGGPFFCTFYLNRWYTKEDEGMHKGEKNLRPQDMYIDLGRKNNTEAFKEIRGK